MTGLDRTALRERGPWALRRLSVTSANSDMTVTDEGRFGFSVVLVKVYPNIDVSLVTVFGVYKRDATHQIPSLVFDTLQLVLRHDGPNTVRNTGTILESEIQLDLIRGSVIKLDESVEKLVDELERIVTWPESERGVQSRDSATASGEYEEVGIAVCGNVVNKASL